jgi:hypothetical protein
MSVVCNGMISQIKSGMGRYEARARRVRANGENFGGAASRHVGLAPTYIPWEYVGAPRGDSARASDAGVTLARILFKSPIFAAASVIWVAWCVFSGTRQKLL